MSSIDERIVGMKFDNRQFESATKDTMSTIDKLKASLNFDASKKSLEDLAVAGKNLNLEHLGANVETIAEKFRALGIIGVTALVNISNKAVDAGLQMAKSLTIDPIKAGFDEYELKLGSIQTILANTAKYGTNLETVNAELEKLNEYSDKTIYNFGDMTKNIGLFTNAGIRVEDATDMIKGFSNAAAASGTTAEGAAGAAYQLSQALSSGTIRLMDWKSLTNVGMGNKNMQDGIIQIAGAMGMFNKNTTSAREATKNFNASLETGWLSADVMTNYLKIMAGEMSEAEMAAMGLSSAQIASFKATQKTAEEAATKVRTFSQLIGTLREAVGSGWSKTFELLVGDFNGATTLWTQVNNTLGGIIGEMSEARNKMLEGFVALGGRQDILDIFTNLWKSLMNIVKPIQDAWAKIFPADGGSGLKSFTGGLREVSKVIVYVTRAFTKLQPVFEVVFGLLKIGWDIVKGIAGSFVNLLSLFGGGGLGGITGLVGGFAALVAKMVEFVNQGKYVEKFFTGLQAAHTAVLQPLIQFFIKLKEAIVEFAKTGDKAAFVENLKSSLTVFAPLIDTVSAKLQIVSGWFQDIGEKLQELGGKGTGFFGTIGNAIAIAGGYLSDFAKGFKGVSDILTKGDFIGADNTFGFAEDSKAVDTLFDVRDGLLGVKDASSAAGKSLQTGVVDTGERVTTVWERISGFFNSAWNAIQPVAAKIGTVLSNIGGKIGEFLDSLTAQDALALVNTGIFMAAYLSVKKFMDSFRSVFEGLGGTFENVGKIFESLNEHLKTMQNDIKSNMILKIAIALGILAAAVWVLAGIDHGKLLVAVTAIAVLFKMLTWTVTDMVDSIGPSETGKIVALGVTLMLLGGAILLLSAALKIMASIPIGDLAKALGALAVTLAIMAGAVKILPEKDLVKTAAAIAILGGAMLILSTALLAFSAMDVGTVGEGLAYIAASLAVMAGVMKIIPDTAMVKFAVSVGLMSASLLLLSTAILAFSAMNVATVAEGLGYIGASMLVLAGGLAIMSGQMMGVVVMAAAAGSLMLLAMAMKIMSGFSWEEIGKGLLVIVAIIGIFAGLSVLLTPLLPVMLALGVALGLLGAAMFLAGAGMLAFGTGFALLAAAVIGGGGALISGFTALIEMIPLLMQQIGLGVLAFAKVIEEGGPAIVGAISTVIESLLEAIDRNVPKFLVVMTNILMTFLKAVQIVGPQYIATMVTLIKALVNAIVNMVPFLVDAGYRLIVGVLNGIAKNVPKIIEAGKSLIISFITGIGSAALEIVKAAADTLIKFLNGLATAIREKTPQIQAAGRNIASAILEGITGGLTGGIKAVADAAANIGRSALNAAKNVLGIHSPSKEFMKIGEYSAEGFIKGMTSLDPNKVKDTFGDMLKVVKDAVFSSSEDIGRLKKELEKLYSVKRKNRDKKAIASVAAELAQAQKENAKASKQYKYLTTTGMKLRDSEIRVAKAHEVNTEKLKEANKTLENAIKTRDDYNKSLTTQYSTMGDINKDTQLTTYIGTLQDQIEKTIEFSDKLQQLRTMGLDERMYKKLLAKGLEALPFVDQLLASGASGIADLDRLGDQLESVAGNLGEQAAASLYQAGVDAAQGIVDGLKAQKKELEETAKFLATTIVKAINNELKIKSPSRVLMEVGEYTGEGLIVGLEKMGPAIEKTSENMADKAINALRQSLTQATMDEFDVNPTITPVLDLSELKKGAGSIGGLLTPGGLSVNRSLASAASVAMTRDALAAQGAETGVEAVAKVEFNQYNSSPKTLSEAEIYRQTNNQLSKARLLATGGRS